MANNVDMGLLNRWAPTKGFNDIADVLMRYFGSHQVCSAWDTVHASAGAAIRYGLARHACIGRRNPQLVEIGVAHGNTTALLCQVAREMGGHVTCIDPGIDGVELTTRLDAAGFDRDLWTFHNAYSQDVEPIQDADYLLVDGDHGYPAVCSDMERHGVAVREGGIIDYDDFHVKWPGKFRWLCERWDELQPVTIGPLAILTKRAEHEPVYREVRSMSERDAINWSVAGRAMIA